MSVDGRASQDRDTHTRARTSVAGACPTLTTRQEGLPSPGRRSGRCASSESSTTVRAPGGEGPPFPGPQPEHRDLLTVDHYDVTLDLTGIDWVITGGESGPRARDFDPAWALSVRDQCRAAGVKFSLAV